MSQELALGVGTAIEATRDFATHHMQVLSLAIAPSVGESIVHHARAVKSDLAAPPPATAVLGDFMRSPAPPLPGRRSRMILSRWPRRRCGVRARVPE